MSQHVQAQPHRAPKTGPCTSRLLRLPNEIKYMILDDLDWESYQGMREVDRDFHELLQERERINEHLSSKFEQAYEQNIIANKDNKTYLKVNMNKTLLPCYRCARARPLHRFLATSFLPDPPEPATATNSSAKSLGRWCVDCLSINWWSPTSLQGRRPGPERREQQRNEPDPNTMARHGMWAGIGWCTKCELVKFSRDPRRQKKISILLPGCKHRASEALARIKQDVAELREKLKTLGTEGEDVRQERAHLEKRLQNQKLCFMELHGMERLFKKPAYPHDVEEYWGPHAFRR
ncbi:MAG: hypothetical protein Q9227_008046 [Pyrenula ochraceoflavens]